MNDAIPQSTWTVSAYPGVPFRYEARWNSFRDPTEYALQYASVQGTVETIRQEEQDPTTGGFRQREMTWLAVTRPGPNGPVVLGYLPVLDLQGMPLLVSSKEHSDTTDTGFDKDKAIEQGKKYQFMMGGNIPYPVSTTHCCGVQLSHRCLS